MLFVEHFFEMRARIEKLTAEPLSDRVHTDVEQAEAENTAYEMQVEQAEDMFRDFWIDSISPEVKEATINQLIKMKCDDILKKIDKFSDLSNFIDAETLQKIRGK